MAVFAKTKSVNQISNLTGVLLFAFSAVVADCAGFPVVLSLVDLFIIRQFDDRRWSSKGVSIVLTLL